MLDRVEWSHGQKLLGSMTTILKGAVQKLGKPAMTKVKV